MTTRINKDTGAKLLAVGKLPAALNAFERAAAEAPADPGPRHKMAEIFARQQQVPAAIAQYVAAASLYLARGETAKALAVCRLILRLDPTHAFAREQVAALDDRRRLGRQ